MRRTLSTQFITTQKAHQFNTPPTPLNKICQNTKVADMALHTSDKQMEPSFAHELSEFWGLVEDGVAQRAGEDNRVVFFVLGEDY
jgi:hypothetical protein